VPNPGPEVKSFMKGSRDFETAIQTAFHMGENSDPVPVMDEIISPDPLVRISQDDANCTAPNDRPNGPVAQSYAAHLTRFTEMSEEERMAFDPYRPVYEVAQARIGDLSIRLGLDPTETLSSHNHWLFDSAEKTTFVLDQSARESANFMLRIAHRYERWSNFTDLALRLISFGVSEADAERVLSIQKNIGGLHGTRFGITTMEARLRTLASIPREIKRHVRHDDEQTALDTVRATEQIGEELTDGPGDEGDSESDSDAGDDSDRE
jgi:hypothetical protein